LAVNPRTNFFVVTLSDRVIFSSPESYGTKIVDNGVNDTRIIGTITLCIMIVVCAVGMEWESKAQNFLLVSIVAAIVCFIIGIIMGPQSEEEVSQGFVGISSKVLSENMGPDYRFSEGIDQSFFTVFAIFFPSVTGLQAGANICGDLKDPASAIPKGTLWALLLSGISYVVFMLFAGAAALRDASGNITEMVMQEHGNYSCILDHVSSSFSTDFMVSHFHVLLISPARMACKTTTASCN
jgi:solute carrier family 12 (sodium/potassium/chloride transporter), member 2